MSSSPSPTDRNLAIAAIAVALAALIAAGAFLGSRSNDSSAGTASAATAATADSTPPAEEGLAEVDPGADGDATCRVRINSAVLRPDPDTARGWAELGLEARPISPAVGTPTGFEFKVTSSTRVACDLHTGVVGTRGGMQFILGENKLDLRRTRLDFGSGLMRMFPKSTGFDGINASGLSLGESSVVQNGNEVTVIVPLRATPDVAGQMNLALGQEVFTSDGTVGTFHLVGERQLVGG